MFSRRVTVDGREIWVPCTPETPISEVLERAANLARAFEPSKSDYKPPVAM